jgi:hypothetical protein
MSYEVEFFVEALILTANDDDLHACSPSQCSPKLYAAIDQFLKGFKRHLENIDFDMDQLDLLNRNFGASVYFSLTDSGVGFYDEQDPVGKELHELLIKYAGRYRFSNLESYLSVDNCDRIVLGVYDENTEQLMETLFQV